MSRPGITFDDRRLAEAVRFLQRREPEAGADIPARPEPGEPLESFIVRRARSHPEAGRLQDRLQRLDRVLAGITGGWMVFMLVLGVAATAAVLRGPRDADGFRTLNLLEFVGGVLGVQSLLLLGWAVLTVALPRSVVPGLLAWLPRETLRRRLRPRGRRGAGDASSSAAIAAARATAEPLTTAGIARAEAGVLTHGSWVMFNIGVILALVVLLGTRGYRVTWETTLLSPAQGERLVRTLLSVPRASGLPGPDEAAVARASIGGGTGQPEEDRRAWGWAIVGMVATLGLAPRTGLLAGMMVLRARRRRGWRLDLEQPEHQSLRARLERAATTVHIEQPADPAVRPGSRAGEPATRPAAADEAEGPVVLLRLESAVPAAWPPPLNAVRWNDLGLVDGREDERAAVAAVAGTAGRTLLVVADLALTPDRGHGRFIGDLVAAASGGAGLVLTGGQGFRHRVGGDAEAVGRRVEAWRAVAAAGGIESQRVLECDLDHATQGSLAPLAAMLGRSVDAPDAPDAPATDASATAGGLDASLTLIVTAVGGWTGEPGPAELAELHLSIHRCLGAAPGGLVAGPRRPTATATATATLREAAGRLAAADPQSMASAMQRGAREMLERVPEGLRAGGRWAVAGSVAGACGCLAAAVAVAPVAITALPAWAGGGAVLAATLRTLATAGAGAAERGEPATGGPADVSAAVDAAILQCLVLHLQGHPEAEIAAMLERVLGPMSDPPPPLPPGDRDGARRRTDAVRDRLDLVMAERARAAGDAEGGRR